MTVLNHSAGFSMESEVHAGSGTLSQNKKNKKNQGTEAATVWVLQQCYTAQHFGKIWRFKIGHLSIHKL